MATHQGGSVRCRRLGQKSIGANIRGHRVVGVIIGPPQSEVTQQRLRGIADVFSREGVRLALRHCEYLPESGASAAENLLSSDRQITCLLAGSDAVALGVINRLHALGFRVPQDIAVASIGNTGLSSKLGLKVTTVNIGLADCGRAAIDHILNKARGISSVTEDWIFKPQLVKGDTL